MNVVPLPEIPDQSPDQPIALVAPATSPDDGDSRLHRFRRGLERFRGDADAYATGDPPDGEANLELAVLLLREENARLKAERHRPTDVGTMIAQMRLTAAKRGEDELSDEAWSLLSDCLVIQEELAQACEEIKAAMSAVQGRLARLAITIQGSSSELPEAPIPDADAGLPNGAIGLSDSAVVQITTDGSHADLRH